MTRSLACRSIFSFVEGSQNRAFLGDSPNTQSVSWKLKSVIWAAPLDEGEVDYSPAIRSVSSLQLLRASS